MIPMSVRGQKDKNSLPKNSDEKVNRQKKPAAIFKSYSNNFRFDIDGIENNAEA